MFQGKHSPQDSDWNVYLPLPPRTITPKPRLSVRRGSSDDVEAEFDATPRSCLAVWPLVPTPALAPRLPAKRASAPRGPFFCGTGVQTCFDANFAESWHELYARHVDVACRAQNTVVFDELR